MPPPLPSITCLHSLAPDKEVGACAMCSMDDGELVVSLLQKERHLATMLGVKCSIGGVEVQNVALVDQGATNSFIRESYLDNVLVSRVDDMQIAILKTQPTAKTAFDQLIICTAVVSLPISMEGKCFVGNHRF